MYEIGITYCNDVSFTHQHDDARGAVSEYALMLLEAIEPTGLGNNIRHIRMVSLIGFDEDRSVVRHITSGIIDCEHRAGVNA